MAGVVQAIRVFGRGKDVMPGPKAGHDGDDIIPRNDVGMIL
jgi:hypothetical protein